MTTTALTEFDRLVAQMVAMKIPREKAEAAARLELGIQPRSAMEALCDAALVEQLEDDAVAEGDRIMQALGWVPIRMSQKRRSKVTAGIPDRYFLHPRRRLALWWEAKTPTGRASPEQLQFQALCQSAGVHHVLGGLAPLRQWLIDHQVASFDETGLPHPIPFDNA